MKPTEEIMKDAIKTAILYKRQNLCLTAVLAVSVILNIVLIVWNVL